MAKKKKYSVSTDDILSKYGVTQTTGREESSSNTVSTTKTTTRSSGNSKADSILSKYGMTQVVGNTDDVDQWQKDSVDLLSKWKDSSDTASFGKTYNSKIYELIASGSKYRDLYKDDAEAKKTIDSIVTALSGVTRSFSFDAPVKDTKDDDIAPVAERKSFWDILLETQASGQYDNPAAAAGAQLGTAIGKYLSQDKNGEKWYEGWFQKGASDEDVGKAILGTSGDAAVDVTAGSIGFIEGAIDWIAGQAPNAIRTQGQYDNPAAAFGADLGRVISNLIRGKDIAYDPTQEAMERAYAQAEKDVTEFIKKDIIDEEAVAKEIVSRLNSAAYMYNINQSGAFATPEQVAYAQQMAQKDREYIENEMEEDSVFAHKVDELMQSAGQLASTAAISATGVPWWLVSGTTAWGSEMENALKEGATLGEANLSGAISAGAEVLTEQISGGIKFGGKTLDDALTKRLAANISSKFWRTAAKLGMDMAGEGLEEVVSEDISRFGQWLTYQDENTLVEMLWSEEAMDAKIQAFLSGAALGGGGSVTSAVQSTIKGVDPVSGLTKNEQAVVDKVYQDEVAEAEKNGTVTEKQKSEIYNKVLEQMDKGYISTDTIEEVLGGDSYKTYKETVDSEDALQKEFDELGELDHPTLKQQSRYQQLGRQLKRMKKNSQRNLLKAQLSKNVYELTKGDRLRESYFEVVRAKQKYEADLSQYEGRARDVIQKVMESGLADNTNQTHDFWDWVAKMSTDLDTDITLATNEEILEMVKAEHEANGKVFDESKFKNQIIDGFASKNGIAINASTKRALNFVVGHEITHKLEKSKHYEGLQKLLFEYAKGEYESRYNTRAGQYKGKYADDEKFKSKVDMEVTGDLVGDYLFSDKGFIDHLTKDQNVFQKVWNEIKYMAKIATAGSEQAKQLEMVKREFERAYRDANKGQSGTIQHSLSPVEAVQPKSDKWSRTLTTDEVKAQFPDLWDVAADESEVRNPTQISGTVKSYRKIYDHLKSEGFDGTILDASSGLGYGTKAGIEEYGFDVDDIEPYPDKSYNPKYTDYSTLDKKYDAIISNAVLNVLPQDQRDALVVKMGEMLNDGGRIFVNVRGTDVKNASSKVAINEDLMEYYIAQSGSYQKGFKAAELVAYLQDTLGDGFTVEPTKMFGAVSAVVTKDGGVQYSVSDSDGKQLSKGQQEFFKDSKMRDENGNLKVMYHGSQDAGFHTFDSRFSDDDTSFFFIDSNEGAETYSGSSEVYEARTIRSAEDMNNFLAEMGEEDYKVVEENGKFTLYQENEKVADSDTAQGIYEEYCDWVGVGYGDANYKVYLNLKNPLVVDAKGRNWNRISGEFSQEIYDRYKTLTDAEKESLVQLAAWEDSSIFRDEMETAVESVERGASYVDDYTRNLASAAEKLGDADMYRLFDIATDNFSEESLRENAVQYLKTRDYAQRAKEQGYDGVIFQNIHDYGTYADGSEGASTVAIAFDSNQIKSTANANPTADPDIRYSVSEAQNQKGLNREQEVTYSISNDSKYMDKAIQKNEANKGYAYHVDPQRLAVTKALREKIAARMNEIKDRGLVGLPEDIEGNTYIANSSYDGTEENTTICPRSLASEAFVDAVSEYLGRPLTVEEQIYISQDLQGRSLTPECTYCYVATDRKAYRAFLGEYINQRDAVLQKLTDNPTADVSRSGELYKEFLNGRKDTNPMYSRFKMWVDAHKNGTPMVDASHLANINRLMGDINSEFGAELKPQIVDAMKYAQSASWAKKRVNYVAYNGHILNWKQDRINKLNSHYGLRMYSFSDFHPAFVLENMQMITDASVRGLKMLGYTKDTDFVDIFAPSGMNINVSTFGFESGGNVYENNLIGAEWEKAKALREQYPNVGVTFVANNDTLVNWALEQDWIDVVIPYHLVRTGAEVAKAFGYTNYTSESADTKTKDWAKGDKKYIAPTEHNNDLATYLAALEKNHLKPRFERFIDNPNYMKLVNECRQPASVSKPVQPVFNEEAAMKALAKLEANGYYQPIGGSVDRMYEIAAEVAEDMTQQLAPAMSVSDIGQQHKEYGDYHVYAKDMLLNPQEIAPVQEAAPVENTSPVVTKNAIADFPDDQVPMAEDESATQERLASLDDADVPPEAEAPYYEEDAPAAPEDPFENRDIKEVGKKNVKAYMYENPEVKPFFRAEANVMLGELQNTTKGSKLYNDELYYESGGEQGWEGTKRHTSDDIAYLRDELGYSYAEIEKGLKAIIEDNGKENIAVAKRIEFILNDRLSKGYTDFETGMDIPADQDYINLLNQKRISEYSEEAFARLMETEPAMEDIAPVPETVSEMETVEDVAPVKESYEAIRPKREPQPKLVRADDIAPEYGDKLLRVDSNNGRPGEKQRKWVGTSTESDAVDGKVLPDDLDQDLIHYQPISNKKTLGNANARLDRMGYEASVTYLNSQFANNKVTLDDIALGERLIQEAVKRGDTKTAGDLIMDISILGTELGQKVQALSIIKRLTPEGQLRMLQRTIERGKTKGDKAFEGVELTQEMIDHILKTYGKDGTYDQDELNKRVEDVKQKIADQMQVTKMDKVNAWRYLSMLGNPKTHIRNLVSNVAMKGTVAVKNAVARTIESIAPIENRTKTWKFASKDVKKFAQQTAIEMKDIISGDSKYSESASIKEKRAIFKNKILNGVYEFNSDLLGKEDWWFSKPAFTDALSEFLTANGITTEADIQNNPKIVEKAKQYALEQSQIATFRQYSWLSNKINEIERKNAATNIAVGAILPFKKTPVNIAKTGLNYSPLGFAKTLTYDVSQVKNGKMEASELVDHLAQNVTGSALTLVGYMLASAGFLNGAGEDDKEGEYDYQLGEQSYSVNIGDATFSLSWLSPVAMPLFVGANAYEQLVEGKEWNGDVVVETLAQTLDPLSEMSFISSLDSVLSSYDSGIEKFAGIFETAAQSYVGQFVPTLSSQVAQVMDDTKRSTKVAADSDFKFFDETVNKLMYKIPGLRSLLEPSTDIWGNEIKQTENVLERAFETFLAPYARREDIATAVDEEIKDLYSQTGDTGLIPSIPNNYVSYDGEKYEMSAKEFTEFKKMYGQTAFDLMEQLFDTDTYRNADSETRADMVNRVYDYARDEARKEYFAKQGVEFTNATKEGKEYYKPDAIKGAIENDMPVDEYVFSEEYPEKYNFLKNNGVTYSDYQNGSEEFKDAYTWAFKNPEKFTLSKAVASDVVTYRKYTGELYDIKADKDSSGKSISGSRKEKVIDYVNNMDADYGQKIILFKSEYPADDTYNYDIIDYLNSRSDISYEEMATILKELGFTVDSKGNITWD